MTLLITGGNGYVGSQLVNYLIDDESYNEIVILDQIEPNKNLGSKPQFKNKVRFVKGSTTDYQKVCEAIENVTQVIHLAAIADVKRCQENPEETRKINVDATQNILEAIKNSTVKRFVFASTMSAIYGKSRNFDEAAIPTPITEYGKQKQKCEELIQKFSNQVGISSIILRKSNLYGTGIITKENVVASFVKQALNDNSIKIEGSGNQFRNFLNLNDSCQAYMKSLTCKMENSCEIINIAGAITSNLNDLAQLVKEQVELKIGNKIELIHSINKRIDDYKKVEVPKISVAKAKKILDYNPQVSLKMGIQELIEHYLER